MCLQRKGNQLLAYAVYKLRTTYKYIHTWYTYTRKLKHKSAEIFHLKCKNSKGWRWENRALEQWVSSSELLHSIFHLHVERRQSSSNFSNMVVFLSTQLYQLQSIHGQGWLIVIKLCPAVTGPCITGNGYHMAQNPRITTSTTFHGDSVALILFQVNNTKHIRLTNFYNSCFVSAFSEKTCHFLNTHGFGSMSD